MSTLTKQEISNILSNPKSYANNVTLDKLVSTLEYLSDYYYNKDTPLIPDSIYDILIDVLEERDPTNKLLKQTGVIPESTTVTKLPYLMPSLDKIKADVKALTKWKGQYKGPYVLSDKLDGISGLLVKNSGNDIKLYKKTTSSTGTDISYLVPYVLTRKYDLGLIPDGTAIRGEFIMGNKDFKKIKHKYKNVRNTISGLVNSKNYSIQVAKLTTFVAYSILNPRMPQDQQMKTLSSFNIPVVNYTIKNDIDNDFLSKYYEQRRKESMYDIDGIVVVDSSKGYKIPAEKPKYAFAFKQYLTENMVETTIIDVEWNLTMYGKFAPTLKLQPVKLTGVTITNATAFNAKYVVDNKLGPGSIVKVIRSGDVIPYIYEVISKSASGIAKMPDIPYEWTSSGVDIVATDIHGSTKDIITIRQLSYFFKTIGVKHISNGIITKLVSNGYKSLNAILTADLDKLATIDGIGKKIISKVFNNIKDRFGIIKLATLMSASGVFGRGFGEKMISEILSNYPNILHEKWSIEKVKDKIIELDGFNKITATQFSNSLNTFKQFVNDLKKVPYIKNNIDRLIKRQTTKKQSLGRLANKRIVFTGFRDADLKDKIIKLDGSVADNVSKNTDIVIYHPSVKGKAKYNKAVSLGVTMLTKDEFIEKYNI